MSKKRKKRSPYQKLKKDCSDWLSRYVRLRDAKKESVLGLSYGVGYVKCYTCSKVNHIKNMHAGHFIGRSLGGSSGVYFAEENVHTQCAQCNAFMGGNVAKYEENLIEEYGEEAIGQLRIKHKTNSYNTEKLEKLRVFYQMEVEKLLKELGIQQWW